jgi:UDP-N-acetylmuramate: L-alanyl-gamma-D-glutamyl-meso-diaminopimelate ligase
MGGVAAIARAAGHRVTGSDRAVYPPMSNQLESLGIELIEGFDPDQLDLNPDLLVVGNIMSRGMPIVEEMLNRGLAYQSGPAWLAQHVLKDQHVIAVTGTHGKTTTASITAWLLDAAGLEPGFLIGGVPANFETTARLGGGEYFVIEADEYDTAFFDKRAKFMHYGPQTLIINNLEFDHADIYKDIDAILWQFHQLLRLLPGNAQIIANAAPRESAIRTLFDMGCWTPLTTYTSDPDATADWHISSNGELVWRSDDSTYSGGRLALPGTHNLENAAAALLAAQRVGIEPDAALSALQSFRGVKRRLEHLGTYGGVRVFDDFAHHPTAIERTLTAVSSTASGRVIAVLEPRSNSMKLGAHSADLGAALEQADMVWLLQPEDLPWRLADAMGERAGLHIATDIDSIVAGVTSVAQPNDDIIIMSNGGFGGIHGRLCAALAQRSGSE